MRLHRFGRFTGASLLAAVAFCAAAIAQTPEEQSRVNAPRLSFTWGVKIPMRDGIALRATVYRPKDQKETAPCVFTLTPYISQSYHERGVYFAAHGYAFLTVDVRGRGNSEGIFKSHETDAQDGYDIVEWLASQAYCNGKVAMWGGSYAGNNQWIIAAMGAPPHLSTIVPAASDHEGVDWPMRNNISYPYVMQWLTFTSGRASQDKIFGDDAFWAAKFREWFESGRPFRELDRIVGNPSPIFQGWVGRLEQPDWDSVNPTPQQYSKLSLPILTITGSYDDDQPGALAFYREHMQYGNAKAKSRHYLIIGPWDHPGTRTPKPEFGGLKFGPASLVDLPKLHTEWYAWTMQSGPQPEFLKNRVAYYVTGAEKWRYADTLEGITTEVRPFYLDSADGSANEVFRSGALTPGEAGQGQPDHYVYDPRDVSGAALEAQIDPSMLNDQRMLLASGGKLLVYHSAPFAQDTEISGFFKLSAWLALDQPDTDFAVSVHEVLPDGSSVRLSTDVMRARYRENLREGRATPNGKVLRYDFDRFTFISRQVKKGSRLRLVFSPINSIYSEKNYNSGGVVAEESMKDARPVTVMLYHDRSHPSALYVPMAAGENVRSR